METSIMAGIRMGSDNIHGTCLFVIPY